ncbi:MAG: hypothetical protein SWH54_03960 [Thermodesulfobacteriota bacterium]|nr:hypothetical protein [Thermodesulfobacteriota bacterium]
MYEEQEQMKQLETGWRVVLLIWGAILASLGIYFVVCMIIEKEMQINIDPKLPLETIKYTLFGVSIITLFVVYYLRKFLLRTTSSTIISSQTSLPQHPAVGKYLVSVIITSALLESIGIYGVVLFFLAKDTSSLYQLLIISAGAMIYFRPRKDELLNMAAQMEAQRKK